MGLRSQAHCRVEIWSLHQLVSFCSPMIWRGHVFCVLWVCFTWNVPLFTFGDLSSTEWLMQQGSVVVPTISCLSWDVYDARLLNDFVLNALAVFILDTALVHVALVDDGGAVGFGCAKDTPKSLSFFVRSTGGSVCTKVVGGLEVGEAGNWPLHYKFQCTCLHFISFKAVFLYRGLYT